MRIAFIANGLSYGGAEKMLVFVASELSKRGYQVAILNTCEHTGNSQPIPESVVVYEAKITARNKKIKYLQRLLFCIRSARNFKAKVIIGFLFFPNLYSVLTGKVLHIPSIISERADPFLENANNNTLDNILLKIVCSASGAVFQTDGASMFYPEALRNRSAVIPNPIAITKKYNSVEYAKRENIVVSLGRIDNQQKRLDVLIDAFEIFHTTHPGWQLHIYGGGPDKELIEKMIGEKHLGEYVLLKGVSQNSFEDISKGKIFAISSDYEGISNSLLEAMAVGMPVVSTDHSPGGARFLITSEENGLLTPMGDAPQFADAMSKFADSPEYASSCGKNAEKVLHTYSPKIIIDKWEKYLAEIV